MLKLPSPPSSPEHTWLLPFCPFRQVASSLVHTSKHCPFPRYHRIHLHQQRVSGMSTLTLESVWLSLWSVLSCPHSLGGPSVTTWKAGHRADTQICPTPWSHSQDALCPLACGRGRTHGVLLPFFRRLNSGVGRGAVWVGDGGHSRH